MEYVTAVTGRPSATERKWDPTLSCENKRTTLRVSRSCFARELAVFPWSPLGRENNSRPSGTRLQLCL
jgi:hypothetical protein